MEGGLIDSGPEPAPLPLVELTTLDAERLYLFVAGAGIGEGIAVALPGTGWLLVDGCAPRETEPTLLALYDRFKRPDDRLHAMVLTHPHDDHAQGFALAVEKLKPERIVITARSPEGEHLLQCTRAWLARKPQLPTSDRLRHDTVVSALKAIETWEDLHPGGILKGVDGQSIPLPGSAVSAFIRAPEMGTHLDSVLDELSQGQRARANHASLVIELVFGATRLVLGGDLPSEYNKGAAVPTGWKRVMRSHKHLIDHTLLKLPHHGSKGAFESTLMAAGAIGRVWVCTPYDGSGLPRRAQALPWLLSRNQPLHITHPSSRWTPVPQAPRLRVSLAQLVDTRGGTGDPFADGAENLRSPSPPSALAPVWGFAFDGSGTVQGQWFGESALALIP